MSRRRLGSVILTGFLATTLLAAPASAQFRWPWERDPTPPPAAPAPLPAPAPAPSAQTPGMVPQAPAGLPVIAILPPKRPSTLDTGMAIASTAPIMPAAAAPTSVTQVAAPAAAPSPAPAALTTAPPPGPMSDRAVVERANAYFNGLNSLVGDFVQVGGDGRRLTGKIYLQRPGKLRFDYAAPSTLEVIADGSSVAVRDSKLATQDLYPISQTPLKFLLRDRIDLGRDVKITDVSQDPQGVRVSLEDSSTLGGTSKITLFFDPTLENLNQWRILDPQGFQTTVVLSNLDKTRRVDNRLFVINYERAIGTESSR